MTWQMPNNGSPGAYLRRAQSLHEQVPHAKNRRAVVQAGGHIGIYPSILAEYFEQVYTFEPDGNNFQCLVANCAKPNVYVARGLLGEVRGCRELRVSKNSGGHNVGAKGPVPTYRIDDLALAKCDAIFLDIEGFEIPALRGAMDTIKRAHPLLVVEENKKLHGKGFQFGDIERLLAPFGYTVIARMGEDLVLK